MSARIQGYAFLSLAMILVGSTVTVSKIIGAGMSPFLATALRFALAFPLFCLLMHVTGSKWPRPGRGDWLILILQAAAGSVGYSALMLLGLKLTSASDASILVGTLPVVAAALAVIVLGERPERGLLAMVLLAALGAGIISFQGKASGGNFVMGNVLVFAAVACEAVFILLNKRLKRDIEPLALSTLMTGLGLLLVLLPAAWEARSQATVPPQALWAIAYYAIVPTVGGYILWYSGSARVSGAEASLFTALAPVSGMLLSVWLLAEPMAWPQVAGLICVLAAILFPVLRRRSQAGREPA